MAFPEDLLHTARLFQRQHPVAAGILWGVLFVAFCIGMALVVSG